MVSTHFCARAVFFCNSDNLATLRVSNLSADGLLTVIFNSFSSIMASWSVGSEHTNGKAMGVIRVELHHDPVPATLGLVLNQGDAVAAQ